MKYLVAMIVFLLLGSVPLALSCAQPYLNVDKRTASAKSALTSCTMLDGGAPISGTWEAITPSGVSLDPAFKTATGTNYGTKAFVVDPNNTATVYLGTSSQGIYKSTDCGSTWVHVNTGTNGTKLDGGRNWTMLVDPVDSSIYTTAGYGADGFWKSTDGGVDWTQLLTANILASAPYGGFVSYSAMDPTDRTHLLVGFHLQCKSPAPANCIAESHDSGSTWAFTNAPTAPSEKDGVTIIGGSTWIYGAQGSGTSGGIWRTTDGGGTWSQVSTDAASGHTYISPVDGNYYTASGWGPRMSVNQGATWAQVYTRSTQSLTGNGTTMYASKSFCANPPGSPFQPYYSAPDGADAGWGALTSPSMNTGGLYMAYDTTNSVLYSSNCLGGFWRAWIGP